LLKRKAGALFVAIAAATIGIVVSGPASAADEGGGIPAIPVNGRHVGNGVRLYVDVFYARGGNPGPPGGGGAGGTVNCTDNNTQTGFAAPFANETPQTLNELQSTFPVGLDVDGALKNAAKQWKDAGGRLTLQAAPQGSPTGPAQDGTSVIGFTKIAPKNVLAATWTYVDDTTSNVLEADVFFNTLNSWITLSGCPSSPTGKFDVADIATHEMGHVLGLNHFSDVGAQSTMYPSAPPDEVRKITLTQGDKDALAATVTP